MYISLLPPQTVRELIIKKTQTKYIYNIKSLNINFGYLFCMLRKFKNRTQNRA